MQAGPLNGDAETLQDRLHGLVTPQQHHNHEEHIRRPGKQHLAFVMCDPAGSNVPEIEFVARFPHAQERNQRTHGSDRRQNIGELRPDEIRHQELRAGECNSTDRGRRQNGAQSAPSTHHRDHVRWNEQRNRGADSADACAQTLDGQPCSSSQSHNRYGNGPEGYRRGIGEQTDCCGQKWRKSETGEHRGSNGHGCSESGAAFDKRAECERDEHHLQAPVIGEVADGIFQNVESSALLRHAI